MLATPPWFQTFKCRQRNINIQLNGVFTMLCLWKVPTESCYSYISPAGAHSSNWGPCTGQRVISLCTERGENDLNIKILQGCPVDINCKYQECSTFITKMSVCTYWGRKLHHNLQQRTAGRAGLLHPNSSAVFPWKPQVAKSLWWGHRIPRLRGQRCHRTWRDVDINKTELAFCWLKT